MLSSQGSTCKCQVSCSCKKLGNCLFQEGRNTRKRKLLKLVFDDEVTFYLNSADITNVQFARIVEKHESALKFNISDFKCLQKLCVSFLARLDPGCILCRVFHCCSKRKWGSYAPEPVWTLIVTRSQDGASGWLNLLVSIESKLISTIPPQFREVLSLSGSSFRFQKTDAFVVGIETSWAPGQSEYLV